MSMFLWKNFYASLLHRALVRSLFGAIAEKFQEIPPLTSAKSRVAFFLLRPLSMGGRRQGPRISRRDF